MNHTQDAMPHNGQLLQQVMNQQHHTQASLARGLNSNQTYVLRQLAKHSIKTQDLWTLSKTLGVNILAILAQQHPVQTPTDKENALQQRVADLEKEVAIYKGLLQGKLG